MASTTPFARALLAALVLTGTLCACARADDAAGLPADLPAYSTRFDASRNAEADFAAALKSAAENHRRVLVMVGGDWCVWCFLLDRHLRADPEAARLMYSGFEMLRVYYNDDNKNEAFLKRFPDFTMFPHFFVVETDAQVLASVPADIFISDAKYNTALIRAFVDRWKP